MGEAKDFLPPRDRTDADVKVAEIVARHRTPVLKGAAEGVSAMEALKCYFTFAQEQLAVAVGKEIAGSMALHGLGKLHSALAERNEARMPAAESKAMTFYQAALLVDPMNYMASNDLGVLMARSGYYAEARVALEQSVSVHAQAAGWQNLAQVYRRLGDNDRAARAESLVQVAQRAEGAARKQQTAGQVQWVDPQAFSQTFAQRPDAREPLPVRQPAGAPKEGAASKPVAQRSIDNLFQKRQ
jgi:tetratricopeptide (TPR) repeat protein